MIGIIVKSQIRKKVKELDEANVIGNVAEEVEQALEKKTEEILKKAIDRAKANQRRTLLARDLWDNKQKLVTYRNNSYAEPSW